LINHLGSLHVNVAEKIWILFQKKLINFMSFLWFNSSNICIPIVSNFCIIFIGWEFVCLSILCNRAMKIGKGAYVQYEIYVEFSYQEWTKKHLRNVLLAHAFADMMASLFSIPLCFLPIYRTLFASCFINRISNFQFCDQCKFFSI